MTRQNTQNSHIIRNKHRLSTDNGKGWFKTHLQKWGQNWDQLKFEDQFEISEPKRGPSEYFNLIIIMTFLMLMVCFKFLKENDTFGW